MGYSLRGEFSAPAEEEKGTIFRSNVIFIFRKEESEVE